MKLFKAAIHFLMIAALVLGGLPHSLQEARAFVGENTYEEIQVLKGDIEMIRTSNLKRVSITDPAIADINDARPKAVEIIGLEPGQTVLFIWDETGKRTVVIRVVTEDLGLVKKRIQSLLASADVKGLMITQNDYEGKVVITGDVSEAKVEVVKSLIDPFGDRVMNLTKKEKIDDLVQIDMQVSELSTTLTKALGIDWLTGTQTGSATTGYTTETTEGGGFSPTAGEIMPGQDGTVGDLFKIGKFYRTTNSALVAKVNAMIVEGKGKVLSKPRLVVISGKEATIQVGGQVPLLSSTVSTGGTATNITFKDYGITMVITPTIENGKKVNILLTVTISDIDKATAQFGSVGFLTRNAQTQIVLDDRQTVVLAGMIKRSGGSTVNRLPFFGSIPIVGMLFRSKSTPDSETEVVISLTPTILRAAVARAEAKIAETQKTPVMASSVSGGSGFSTTRSAIPSPMVSTPGSASEDYAISVQQKIVSAIAYPYEAQEKGWEGMVKLTLVLKKDGTLETVVVKDSSGYEVFDQDAVNTAQILAPYAAFPSDIAADEMTVTIPIVYSLDGFLKNVASQ